MARIPADLSHPEAQPLVERIVAERGSVLCTRCCCTRRRPAAGSTT